MDLGRRRAIMMAPVRLTCAQLTPARRIVGSMGWWLAALVDTSQT